MKYYYLNLPVEYQELCICTNIAGVTNKRFVKNIKSFYGALAKVQDKLNKIFKQEYLPNGIRLFCHAKPEQIVVTIYNDQLWYGKMGGNIFPYKKRYNGFYHFRSCNWKLAKFNTEDCLKILKRNNICRIHEFYEIKNLRVIKDLECFIKPKRHKKLEA